MGRCGGFYGGGCGPCAVPCGPVGCGPCGAGYYGDSFGNCGYGEGFNNNCASDACAVRNNDVACKTREVYYEKENCFNSRDNAYCGNRARNGNCGWSNGNNSYGNGCGGYNGCGPGYGGWADGGCGPNRGYGPRRFGPGSKLHKGLGYKNSNKNNAGWNTNY